MSPQERRFGGPAGGWRDVGSQLHDAANSLRGRHRDSPLPTGDPQAVLAELAVLLGPEVLPEYGIGSQQALQRVAGIIADYGLDLTHPLAAAHLQPPVLSVAVAADALASAGNASLDTYDSGPATLAIEKWTVATLAGLAGLGPQAGGVFGPGGSYSNLLALLIARDQAGMRLGVDIRQQGVATLPEPTVYCSQVAHFSVNRACAALGLGESAVVAIDCDDQHRMRPEALETQLRGAAGSRTPIAVVATAGTTDFGTIDPLVDIADIARRHGVWLHVDAAYGFGALFSDNLDHLLAGIHLADSVTLDLHKIGWQPAAASLLLLADTDSFASLDRSVSYLNPEDDMDAGFGGRLGMTLQTTRRPDALKVATTLMAYGRKGLGEMIDDCHALAHHAQRRIIVEPLLDLVAPVTLSTVVFRYRCDDLDVDQVNAELRRRLIASGLALIGRTQVSIRGEGPPRTCLKLTLLNPQTSGADIDLLFDEILRAAVEVESEGLGARDTDTFADHDKIVRAAHE